MVGMTLPLEPLGLAEFQEELDKAALEGHPTILETLTDRLAKSIMEGTVALEEIELLLRRRRRLSPDLLGYLLYKKASLLLSEDRYEQALESCDESLRISQTPVAWAFRGVALWRMQQFDEAFQAFQNAYSLRQEFGPEQEKLLQEVLRFWSTAALLRAFFGALQQDARELERGVVEYLKVVDKAENESLVGSVTTLPFPEKITEVMSEALRNTLERGYTSEGLSVPDDVLEGARQEIQEALEELELAVRLLSIKDPFEGWRALSQEISKVWPEGISAVDAIREQRDREWNR